MQKLLAVLFVVALVAVTTAQVRMNPIREYRIHGPHLAV